MKIDVGGGGEQTTSTPPRDSTDHSGYTLTTTSASAVHSISIDLAADGNRQTRIQGEPAATILNAVAPGGGGEGSGGGSRRKGGTEQTISTKRPLAAPVSRRQLEQETEGCAVISSNNLRGNTGTEVCESLSICLRLMEKCTVG